MTSEELIQACADYAEENDIDAMLNLIAGVHISFAGFAEEPEFMMGYDAAGVEVIFETDEIDDTPFLVLQ